MRYDTEQGIFARDCSVGFLKNDRNPNAPNYEDLNQQWTLHCQEESRAGRTKKIKGTFFKTQIDTGATSRTE